MRTSRPPVPRPAAVGPGSTLDWNVATGRYPEVEGREGERGRRVGIAYVGVPVVSVPSFTVPPHQLFSDTVSDTVPIASVPPSHLPAPQPAPVISVPTSPLPVEPSTRSPTKIYMGQEVLIYGTGSHVYLTSKGTATRSQSEACRFRITPIPNSPRGRDLLLPGEPFLLQSGGLFFQRCKPTPSPDDLPVHKTHRFALGLGVSKDQSWTVEQGTNINPIDGIPWNSILGLTIGGTNPDLASPNNLHRRYLTVRAADPNVVVSWWRGDEHVEFHRA